MPDLRGLFLRGYGSQTHFQNNGSSVGITSTTHSSGLLNEVQGDTIRDIIGTMKSGNHMRYTGPQYGGAFTSRSARANAGFSGDFGSMFPGDPVDGSDPFFSAARVVPTSTENRPVNMAVRYLIRARP